MRQPLLIVIALCAAMHAAAAGAQAFPTRSTHFGIMGGLDLPTGDFNMAARIGWNAGAVVTVASRFEPLEFRFEGQWQHMNGLISESSPSGPGGYTHFRVIDGTANAVYTLPMEWRESRIYFIAGPGVYFCHSKSDNFPDATTFTKLGVNTGIGLRTEGLGPTAFMELRYHYIVHGSELLNDATSRNKGLNVFVLGLGFVL